MTSPAALNSVALAQALIRCPSVTPVDAGAQGVLAEALAPYGFVAETLTFGEVKNLYLKVGKGRPHLMFAGHTDVVPAGRVENWSVDPFAAEIRDGVLIGRGAVDMKAAIACFAAAAAAKIKAFGGPDKLPGAISFLITADEEGPSIDGTVKALAALAARGENWDACLVGEPTSEDLVADVVKNGRRGSLNAIITATGKQGHVAYPAKAANPIPVLLAALGELNARVLDDGAPGFDPSNLEVTSIDVGNPTTNLIPGSARAGLNIRFNTMHSGDSLTQWIQGVMDQHTTGKVSLSADIKVSGEAFYTNPGPLTDAILAAIAVETGRTARLSTSGGTSDARFIMNYCPVAELGLRNATAHHIDEQAPIADIEALTRIYLRVLDGVFTDV